MTTGTFKAYLKDKDLYSIGQLDSGVFVTSTTGNINTKESSAEFQEVN